MVREAARPYSRIHSETQYTTRMETPEMSSGTATRRWLCEPCGEIYDPVEGDVEAGIAPGTAFEDIPEDWLCPVCGARKTDFVPLDD
jgi:rubredoxin